MKELKVRKIGNSLGSIFPKDWGVEDGAKLEYKVDQQHHKVIIDLNSTAVKHDRELIEKSFAEFDKKSLTEQDMQAKFGKYGWDNVSNYI